MIHCRDISVTEVTLSSALDAVDVLRRACDLIIRLDDDHDTYDPVEWANESLGYSDEVREFALAWLIEHTARDTLLCATHSQLRGYFRDAIAALETECERAKSTS